MADPGFPGGTPNLEKELLFDKIFGRKPHGNERNWTERESANAYPESNATCFSGALWNFKH